MRDDQQLGCLMLFRSKGLNLCFRFSKTNIWMLFSMNFDSSYFSAL